MIEFALIKGFCIGMTSEDNHIRIFLGLLYVGIIIE